MWLIYVIDMWLIIIIIIIIIIYYYYFFCEVKGSIY